MNRDEMVEYIRAQRDGVVSTLGEDGRPQAAYLPIAVTDAGELVFDAKPDSRKIANLGRDPRLAVVIGGADGTTLQAEGRADVLDGSDAARYAAEYVRFFPEFEASVRSGTVVIVRVRLEWTRFGDFRDAVTRASSPEPRRLR